MKMKIEHHIFYDEIKYETKFPRPIQSNGILWLEETPFLWAHIHVPPGTGIEWARINLPNHKILS